MPRSVERTDPDGVDYGRVMQLTFVATILVGAPLVAVLSLGVDLPTWTERATFAVRVGAAVWVVTALTVYAVERRHTDGDAVETTDGGTVERTDDDAPETTDGE